jgi:putative transcriptional regulator
MILKVRLDEILKERNMTQKKLAEISGLRENTISEITKNIRESVNRKHIGKIANALEIKEINELFYFDEE